MHFLSRRSLLGATALVGAGFTLARGAAAETAAASETATTDDFRFEIVRSEAEWRTRLSADEYEILRGGGTEWPTTSPLWNDYTAGAFDCRGCDLPVYGSEHRAPIEKGWVFFYHAEPNTVLTGIDRGNPYAMAEDDRGALIEVHCRRCGSHLGHVLVVDRELVHCINGTSLSFRPESV